MYINFLRAARRERGKKITVENDDEGKTRNGASRKKKSTTAWNRRTKSLSLLKSLPLGMDVRREAQPVSRCAYWKTATSEI